MNADQVLQLKQERVNSQAIQSWHRRINDTGQLYSGDVSVLFQDETARTTELQVPNTVQRGLNDISWLISEQMVTLRCAPKRNTDSEREAAQIRESVGLTYRENKRGRRLDPKLGMDLDGTGAAFLLCYANPKQSKYPIPKRLNPRNCFPDLGMVGQLFDVGQDPGVIDSDLYDFLTVTRMSARQAKNMYALDIDDRGEVEVIDYYDPEQMVKVIEPVMNGSATGTGTRVQQAKNVLGRIPIAFVNLDTFDDQFRGEFDQIGPIMKTLNRLYTLILDDADRTIYDQPIFTPDIDEKTYGIPGKPIIAESIEAAAAVHMLKANSASPTLFPLLAQLERFVHIGAGYPETRGTEPSASIVSGLGISATLGVLKSQVQNLTRLLGDLWREWYSMAFSLDVKTLNFEKPLWRPVGNKYTYLPGKDVGDNYEIRVTFAAGAGVGDLNERVGHLQALGAGVVSKETVMENLQEVEDPLAEMQKIEYEQARSFFLQSTFPQLPPELQAEALLLMGDGKPMRRKASLPKPKLPPLASPFHPSRYKPIRPRSRREAHPTKGSNLFPRSHPHRSRRSLFDRRKETRWQLARIAHRVTRTRR